MPVGSLYNGRSQHVFQSCHMDVKGVKLWKIEGCWLGRGVGRSICAMAFDVQSLHLSTEGKAEPVQLTFCRVSPA